MASKIVFRDALIPLTNNIYQMKNVYSLIFALIISVNSIAQEIVISFDGIGDFTKIDSVQVHNLMSNEKMTVIGGNSLRLQTSAGVGDDLFTENTISIFPNPVVHECNIDINIQKSDKYVVMIHNANGERLYVNSFNLHGRLYSFRLSGLPVGMHLFSVSASGQNYSAKIISLGNGEKIKFDLENANYIYAEEEKSQPVLKNTDAEQSMDFTPGDRLFFKAFSGKNKNVRVYIPTKSLTDTFTFDQCIDVEGNSYTTVQIDHLTWMQENLKTERYNDSSGIMGTTDNFTWSFLARTNPMFCWYNNDKSTYGDGALYSFLVAESGKICPIGWHVPTAEEWNTLSYHPHALRETGKDHWIDNDKATNSTGFTSIPTGQRDEYGEYSGQFESNAYYWSSTRVDGDVAAYRAYINTVNSSFIIIFDYRESGYAIRCIKDY